MVWDALCLALGVKITKFDLTFDVKDEMAIFIAVKVL